MQVNQSNYIINFKKFYDSKISTIIFNVLGWGIFLIVPIFFWNLPKQSIVEFTIITSILIAVFYTNSLVLFPRFLLKGKILIFILSLIALLISSLFLLSVFFKHFDNDKVRLRPHNKEIMAAAESIIDNIKQAENPKSEIIFDKLFEFKSQRMLSKPIRFMFLVLIILIMSSGIRITQEWLRNEKHKKEEDNERLNAELNFLKSQVNPHFLFNTLNSIYSLAYKKSDQTPDAISKLSNILRYMLYETNINTVPLENEYNYLVDFIELQKLRIYDNCNVQFETSGDFSKVQIAPLLLVPFIENAFKHGVDTTSECYIFIKLKIENNDLHFKVENSLPFGNQHISGTDSGIGLKNVQRRLKLLYPDKHLLLIDSDTKKYKINLTIRLQENELHNS